MINKESLEVSNTRLRILSLVLPLIVFLVVIRLFYWQIIKGPKLSSQANRQHQEVVVLNSHRGTIFDVNGDILAGTKILYHLYAYKPQFEKDSKDKYLSFLAPLLTPPTEATSSTRQYLFDRLNLSSNWVSLKHYLTNDQKEQIEKAELSGLGFEEEPVRFYPEASMSAHILGFVGSDISGEPVGYFGLEGFFDRQLKGREGKLLAEKDAFGKPILIGKYNLLKNISGRSIYTTIDKSKQYLVEKTLLEGINKYQAKAGNAILMEVGTAKVRAMVSYPNYNPEHFQDFESTSYKNPTIANLFEPGSIFKILIMAAGLNEEVITTQSICDICHGPLEIGQFTIKTWNEEYHPNSSMVDILVNSDNIGMVFISRKLGREKFIEYLKRLKFGAKTNIELQEEVAGKLKEGSDFREIDLATQSFGQGIAITPLQFISAANTIANKGVYLPPTIIDHFESLDKVILPQKKEGIRVFSEKAAKETLEMMVETISRGEAKWTRPKNFSAAGKTGTAQIPIQGHYDPDKTIASFIGFFPAQNPKYTLLVSLTEPQTSQWGSETAAPLWFSLATKLSL